MKGDAQRAVTPTSRAPVPTRTPAAPRATFDFRKPGDNTPVYKHLKGGNSIGLLGSVADALRRTGEPASAVAYLVQGKPKEALGSLQDIYRQKEQVRTIGLSDVPIIHRATGKLPWYVRTPLRFGIDVAGDPLTYVTFGSAGVARGASGKAVARIGGKQAEMLAAARAAKAGARRGSPEALPLLSETAHAALTKGIEKEGLDSAIQFGLRVPFTREKSITIAGVNTSAARKKAGETVNRIPGVARVTDGVRTSVLPSRGADYAERYVASRVRQAGEVEARAWQREGQDLTARIYKRAKEHGIKPAKLHELIVRHIDDPEHHAAPAFAQDLVDETRSIFERIGARELQDGVVRGSVDGGYIPHILLNDQSRKRVMAKWADAVTAAENPYFIKARAAKTFNDLDHVGAKYETNIDRLIEARASASVRSRQKLAVDAAVWKEHGVGAPLSELDHALPVSRLASTAEWRQMQDGWRQLAGSPRFKDARLPANKADSLERVHRAIDDTMKHPNVTLRFMRQTMGIWKRLALATPGFHIRNQLEDSLRAYWGGARNPLSYGQAIGIQMGKNFTINTRHGRFTADNIFDLARDNGIIDAGFVAQEAASSESRRRGRVEAARYGRARYLNWMRATENASAAREDFNRLGLFIERLKAGDNPTEAADVVRKYLFDYGDVGEFVTVARRYWAPFITYASKSIPLTVSEFAKRPGRMSHIATAQRIAMEEAGNPDLSGLGPDDQFAMPFPLPVARALAAASGARSAKGTEDPVMLFNPRGVMGYTMLSDIKETLPGVGSWKGRQRFVGNYGSPLITKPVEGFLNYSLYNGRAYRDNENVKANALEALIAKATGGRGFGTKHDNYLDRDVLGINPRLAILSRFVPTAGQVSSLATGAPGMSGTSTSPRIGWLRTLGGVPVTPLDRAKEAWYAREYGGK